MQAAVEAEGEEGMWGLHAATLPDMTAAVLAVTALLPAR